MRAAIAAVLLVVVACSGGDEPAVTDVQGIPVLEDHVHGPGTRLADGFTVVDGSTLVGDLLPLRAQYGPVRPEGWRAVLLVTGGAREVLDAYGRQAAAIGLPVTPQFITGACEPDAAVLSCRMEGEQGTSGHRRRIELVLQRGRADRGLAPVSHLELSYETYGEPPYGAIVDRGCTCPPGDRDAAAPEDWPPLPEPGERLEADATSMQPALRVERGSHLVTHPASVGSGVSLTVLLVTGDPEEVLDAYVDQLDESYDRAESRRRFRRSTVLHRFWGQGGGIYQADLVRREGRPTYLVIEHSVND